MSRARTARVRYVGMYDEVDVPALDLTAVKRGQPVTVPAAAAEDLLAQADWEPADTTSTTEERDV